MRTMLMAHGLFLFCIIILLSITAFISLNSRIDSAIPLSTTFNTTNENSTVANFEDPTGLGPTGIYVRNVFRAKDDEIQMFFLKDWRNTQISIEMKINNTWLPFSFLCYYPVCRGTNGYCGFMDYFAYLPIPTDFDEKIAILRVNISKREHQLKILVVHPKKAYAHELAVVLQPAYYLSDWQNLIQYFESWLANGATKFYIYHYSWSKKVQEIIDFYQSILGVGLEVVSWSPLPSFQNDRGIFLKDPNTLIFNLMNFEKKEAALNNALYRARNVAKYLAVMDLDELTITGNLTLLETLEHLQSNRSDIASFWLKWDQYSVKVNLVEFDKPSDINFNYLHKIERVSEDSLPLGYYTSGKCIHRPDNHHNFIHLEWKNQSAGEAYQGFNVDSDDMMAVHLRRIFDADQLKIVESSNILVEHAEKLQKSFYKRISGSPIADKSMSPWVPQHSSILNALHDCRRANADGFSEQLYKENVALMKCRACEPYLTDTSSFIMAEMAWTNIAEPFKILGTPEERKINESIETSDSVV